MCEIVKVIAMRCTIFMYQMDSENRKEKNICENFILTELRKDVVFQVRISLNDVRRVGFRQLHGHQNTDSP